jgi:hypothetical protein
MTTLVRQRIASVLALAAENEKCLATFVVPAGKAGPVPVIVRVSNPCFGPCFHGSPPP